MITTTRLTNVISNIETYTQKLKVFLGSTTKFDKIKNVSVQSHYSVYSLIENELEIIYNSLQIIGNVINPISNVTSAIPPQAITVTNNATANVTITWTAVPDAVQYKVVYKLATDPAWEEIPLYLGKSLTVTTGVLADETYDFAIQTFGLDGTWGELSATDQFEVSAG